jgi:hypothetical protein
MRPQSALRWLLVLVSRSHVVAMKWHWHAVTMSAKSLPTLELQCFDTHFCCTRIRRGRAVSGAVRVESWSSCQCVCGPPSRRMPTCLLSVIDGSTKHRLARQKHFYTSTCSQRLLRVKTEKDVAKSSAVNSIASQVDSQVPRLAGHDTPSTPAPVGRSAKADWAEEALRCCRPSHRQQPAQPPHPNPIRQPPRARCNTSLDAPNCPPPTVAYD